MTCADCVYFIPEYGKHLKGCYLFPYKLTLGNDPACDKFIEGKEKSVEKTDEQVVPLFEFSALISVNIVVACKDKETAKKRVKELSAEGWVQIGDIVDVSDIDLFDVRKCKKTAIEDLAHLRDCG